MDSSQEFMIESPSIKPGHQIDRRHAYKHDNEAPLLRWRNAPRGTKSFAVFVEDPDASTPYPWAHWIVYNIPASQMGLEKPLGRVAELPNGIRQGMNSFNEIGYDGPSPAGIGHRYFFRVYALDVDALPTPGGSRREDVLLAMENHILGKAHIESTYEGP